MWPAAAAQAYTAACANQMSKNIKILDYRQETISWPSGKQAHNMHIF